MSSLLIGAGLTGVICANLNRDLVLIDGKEPKPNHKALLRCKTKKLSQALNIPFKEVKVLKGIYYKGDYISPNPKINNMYSLKTIGNIGTRSLIDISTETRFVPPDDLYQTLFSKVKGQLIKATVEKITKEKITYRYSNSQMETGMPRAKSSCIISTIPMDKLICLAGEKNQAIRFQKKGIWVYIFEIKDCNTYSTVYFPDLNTPIYRATIHGNSLIVESVASKPQMDRFDEVFSALCIKDSIINFQESINNPHYQPYGKIFEIDSLTRKNFIFQQTVQNNIFSIGRFATWRPKLMLEDIPEDYQVIQALMDDKYSLMKYQQGEK